MILKYLFVLLSVVCSVTFSAIPIVLPKIGVKGNLNARYYAGPSDIGSSVNFTFSNESLYIVPSTIAQLVLECNASYPVFWNLADSDINSEMFPYVRVMSKRIVGDIFDTKSFNYTTQIVLGGPGSYSKFTGNYSCQHTAKKSTQSNVFIFWESTGYESLVHSKESLTVFVEKGIVTLPCGISNPNQKRPQLRKMPPKTSGKFEELNLNKYISYSPKIGYTFKNLPNVTGTYKCVMDEENDDIVTIVVKNATTKIKKANATFTFREDTNEAVCCSGGKRPPNIFQMYCNHASTCQFREHVIQPYHYIFSRSKRNGNCVSKTLHFYHTLLLRCVGDGIDEYKELITPVDTGYDYWITKKNFTHKTFFHWEEIDPQDMLMIKIRSTTNYRYFSDQASNEKAVYEKETIVAECATSSYYFSDGNYWAIRWKNKTLTPITDLGRKGLSPGYSLTQTDSLTYTLNSKMESLVCFAPVWNSSIWVTKTHFLYVNETIAPTLIQNDTLEFTWYTNETNKEIVCEAKGIPAPSISWTQGNASVIRSDTHNFNISQIQQNDTTIVKSILIIQRVSYSTHGQYICKVSNYGGSVSQIFTVTVIEVSSWKSATILIVSTVITCFLVIATLFIWRKMKQDQKAIQHLTSVHFKDSNSREQAVGVDASNTTYDNGKMTNQLI